jgi:uncharacterized protein YecE (DUF72 family)
MCNMKFGKLDKIDGIDFTMPPTPKTTQELLKNSAQKKSAPIILSGCTGWYMKEWLGSFYPKNAKAQDFLRFYSRQFNTIELNSTYYRIPDKKSVDKWVEQTLPGFKFAPKIPQIISQSEDLSLRESYIESFTEVIAALDDRLGISFLQLPPNFGPRNIRILEQFLKRFPCKDIPLSVEVRNENWFVEKDMLILQNLLAAYGAGIVLSDVAGRRDVLHMYLSNNTAMIRFVGNELHESDFSRLDAWMLRLKEWVEMGLSEVYFFHHQDNNLLAPEMTIYFNQKLNHVLGTNLTVPVKHSDVQLSLF